MKFKRIAAATLAVTTLLLTGAAPNWLATVSEEGTAHRIGNPAAKVRLTEYVSYTCPHCAEFARQADGPIKLAMLAPGKINVEFRHLIRDPVDLTVGMLVNCGATGKFAGNHDAFILGQNRWITPLARPTGTQTTRWRTPGAAGRRAIAGDFGFYAIMERRGYSRTEVDRCLADEAMARRLAEISAKEWERPGIDATPSFSINGIVMPGTHTWAALEPQIREFL